MVFSLELCSQGVRLLRHIGHLRPQAGIADRQIILGAMTGAVGALASRLAAAFVAFDERTAKDHMEWRQLEQECVAALAQGSRSVGLVFHRTTYKSGLILQQRNTFFNLFVWT